MRTWLLARTLWVSGALPAGSTSKALTLVERLEQGLQIGGLTFCVQRAYKVE